MKPTQKEIAYFTHPDQGWLQKEWEPAVGDRCRGRTKVDFGVLGLCHKYLTKDTELQALTGWAVTDQQSGYLHWYCNKYKRIKEDWLWLPTLSDLLGMIERKWPVIELNIYPQGDWLDDSTASIEVAAECIDWFPDGGGFMLCNECGADLSLTRAWDQSGAYVVVEDKDDVILDDEKLEVAIRVAPRCPHCGDARGESPTIAAAELLKRLKGENDESADLSRMQREEDGQGGVLP